MRSLPVGLPRLPAWPSALAAGALAALAAAVIAAHAGLIGAGDWLGDEYFNFAMLRQHGAGFFFHRLVTWSPRLVSELEIYAYFGAVSAAGRPLVGPFLAVMWAAALAATIGGWKRPGDGPAGVAVPLALFAMFLLGQRIDEVFYWPMGASPYLGGLAAMAFATLRLARDGDRAGSGRVAVIAALLLAAGHTELGIMFSLSLCPLLLVLALARSGRPLARFASAWPWCIPIAYDLVVMALLRAFRLSKPVDPSVLASPTYHRLFASLRAAGPPMLTALGGGAPLAAVARLVLLAGLVLCIPVGTLAPPWLLVALAGAVLATIQLSIFAAYYQDGLLCCGRHDTIRQCLVILLLVMVAAVLARLPARGWLPRAGTAAVGPALIALAIGLSLPGRLAGLAHDYARLPETARQRAATWRSAREPGPDMTFRLPPGGRVTAPGALLEPGRYQIAGHPAWYVWGVLTFFDKATMTVTK